jgi:dipeptidyl aminopeptidase/acylaminoacyl peptidase
MCSNCTNPRRFFRAHWPIVLLILVSRCYSVQVGSHITNPPPDLPLGVNSPKRAITVQDSIRMTRLPVGVYEAGSNAGGEVGEWSPKSDRFAIILETGNLEQNTTESSLFLFDLAGPPRHELLVTMASSSNRPAINSLSWLDDHTIAFLGEKPGELQQLYVFDCTTKSLRKLLGWPANIVAYAVSPGLEETVFLAEDWPKPLTSPSLKHEVIISTQPIWDLLEDDGGASSLGTRCQLYIKRRGEEARRIETKDLIWGTPYPFAWWQLSLSPDGRYAIMQTKVITVPQEWKGYTDPIIGGMVNRAEQNGNPTPIWQYLLIDTAWGSVKPLLDSPSDGYRGRYVWAPDSKSVALSGIFLPLNAESPQAIASRKSRPSIAEIRIPSGQIVEIRAADFTVVRWTTETNELVLRADGADPRYISYRRSATGWAEVSLDVEYAERTPNRAAIVDEAPDRPPRLFLVNRKAQRKELLLDLNPQFREFTFGAIEVMAWKTRDGRQIEGGLYLPPTYTPGVRYPLVIQTHGFEQDRFYIDGPYPTAFAAQALAAKGFVVLQVGKEKDDVRTRALWTESEGPHEMALYESAIDYLDGRGLIDRSKIGLIGFSRTCFGVKYTLTHSHYHFAAAVVSDGFDAGYLQYALNENYQGEFAGEIEQMNGGMPYGSGLLSWLRKSPGFNLDKVDTPLRIEALGSRPKILTQWEWFAGLRRLHKPVEMIFISGGAHILQKPRDRFVSQQGTVDWFSFWLNGEEDPDSSKVGQYQRWRQLRLLQK